MNISILKRAVRFSRACIRCTLFTLFVPILVNAAGMQDRQTPSPEPLQSGNTQIVKEYIERAEAGDRVAARKLGRMYCSSESGIGRNPSEAAKWLTLGARLGDEPAMQDLSSLYLWGDGVPRSFRQAMRWFSLAGPDPKKPLAETRKEAESGNPSAQLLLGLAYDFGDGVEPDKKQALILYRSAAAKGVLLAEVFIGEMYAKGEGVKKDPIEAEKRYSHAMYETLRSVKEIEVKSASSDLKPEEKHKLETAIQLSLPGIWLLDAEMVIIGDIYLEGEGIERNYKKATDWYLRVIERNTSAQDLAATKFRCSRNNSSSISEAACIRQAALDLVTFQWKACK